MGDENCEQLLGRWACIDIETTGIDSLNDEIIDVGYLLFNGVKLEKRYQSLARPQHMPGQFIQKLTGINESMLKAAPSFAEVKGEIEELLGLPLVAHNAEFEKSFLAPIFDRVANFGDERESYVDTLYYLAALFPKSPSLKLERFIVEWGIREKEEHRGLDDAIDMLKVVIVATLNLREDSEKLQMIRTLVSKYKVAGQWPFKFLALERSELLDLAGELEFDPWPCVEKAGQWENNVEDEAEGLQAQYDFKFNGDTIRGLFRDEKKVRETFSHYHYRKTQEDLALRVGQSFKNGVHSLVQAPTGTGKTLGYLIPSSFFCLEDKKQVLVATGTKTLQEQAMKQDIPKLRKLLGLDEKALKVRRLVGSNNHLCELLYRQSVEEEDLFHSGDDLEDNFTNIYFEMAFFHNGRHKSKDAILRADVPFVLKMKLEKFRDKENEIGVDYRSCSGSSCPFKGECSYIKGLREAKEADIIIGNHSLMFSWPKGFPRPEYVVVDEAHRLEGETTEAFSLEVSGHDLEILLKNLTHLQGVGSLFYLLAQHELNEGDSTPLINQIREEILKSNAILNDHVQGLNDRVEMFFKKLPRYTDLFWNEAPMVTNREGAGRGESSLYYTFLSIHQVLKTIYDLLYPYTLRFEISNLSEENQVMAYTRFESFVSGIDDMTNALACSLGIPNFNPNFTRTLRFHAKDGLLINNAPIDIGRIIHDNLLQTSASVVMTSATLANANGNLGVKGIEWASGHSYLGPSRRFKSGLFLEAPFDYAQKTKVFLCDDTPPLYDSLFVETVLKDVGKLIRNIGGRSLLLFSAKTRFEVAREVLLKEFEGEIPLFIQGMGAQVVEEFKKAQNGILLGMESFSEGIDIPGEGLQFVFIDKIPDLRHDLVISQRRSFYETNLGNEFTDYYLAHRARGLHQKLGRLLRSETDIGGAIIVDSRVKGWKGKTMEKFLGLMAPYKMKRSTIKEACREVENFILESHGPESALSVKKGGCLNLSEEVSSGPLPGDLPL